MYVDPRLLRMDVLVEDYVYGIDEDLALYLRSEGLSPWILRRRRSVDAVTATQAIASTPPPSGSNWTWIANESRSFSVSGTQTVRYGAGSSWISRSVTGSGVCSNAFFGPDPAYGVVKHCELAQ